MPSVDEKGSGRVEMTEIEIQTDIQNENRDSLGEITSNTCCSAETGKCDGEVCEWGKLAITEVENRHSPTSELKGIRSESDFDNSLISNTSEVTIPWDMQDSNSEPLTLLESDDTLDGIPSIESYFTDTEESVSDCSKCKISSSHEVNKVFACENEQKITKFENIFNNTNNF